MSILADICSMSLWMLDISEKRGARLVGFSGEAKVESFCRPSFISLSLVRKFRHSSRCAAVSSPMSSETRFRVL